MAARNRHRTADQIAPAEQSSDPQAARRKGRLHRRVQLSQIENGRVSPSIASLKRIASALQSKITDFFVEGQDDDPVVLKQDQRITLSLDRWNARKSNPSW